jgi:large subunit ribosomal protein L15
LETLAAAKNLTKIGIEELREAGFINRNQLVKILANGAVTRALQVEANAYSAAAEKAITEAGGSISKVK